MPLFTASSVSKSRTTSLSWIWKPTTMPSATVARRTRVLAGMSIFAWKEVCGKVCVEDWTFCWLFLRITIESLLQENVSEMQPLFRLIEGAGGTRIKDLRLCPDCALTNWKNSPKEQGR